MKYQFKRKYLQNFRFIRNFKADFYKISVLEEIFIKFQF